jgi:hypothetical protein
MWGLCLYSYERCIHDRRSEDKTDHRGANSDKLYLRSSNAEVYWQCKLKWMSFGNRSNIFPIPRTKWRTVSQELGCASTLKVNCFKQGDNDEWLKSVSMILVTSRSEQLASSPVKLSISSWEASKIPSSAFDERTRAKLRSDLMWSSRKCGERWATRNKWGIFSPTMPLNYLKNTTTPCHNIFSLKIHTITHSSSGTSPSRFIFRRWCQQVTACVLLTSSSRI